MPSGCGQPRRREHECAIGVSAEPISLEEIKSMLQPENALDAGCRVIKHPGACVLCVANNDCKRIPVHFNCRCRPQFYLTSVDEEEL